MPSLESPGERRVCRVGSGALDVEDLCVAGGAGLGHGHVGVALEAVQDAASQAIPVDRGLAIVRGRLRLSSEALLGAVVVVVVGDHGVGGTAQAPGVGGGDSLQALLHGVVGLGGVDVQWWLGGRCRVLVGGGHWLCLWGGAMPG